MKYKKNTIFKRLWITLLLITSHNTLANTGCLGNINYLGINSFGTVYVSLNTSNNINGICSVVQQGSFTMSVDSCKLAYATLLSTRMLGKRITVTYNGNFDCNSIPNWSYQNGAYFINPE